MKKNYSILIFVMLLFLNCNPKKAPQEVNKSLPLHQGEIRISGAFALMPLTQRWISSYQEIHPSVTFSLTPSGSGNAIQNLINDKADLVMISTELSDKLDSIFWIVPVAKLSTVIVVNKNNPYWKLIKEKGLKKDNLNQLFTGEKTFWGDLFGEPGKNKPNVYIRSDNAGATDMLSRYLWVNSSELKGTGTPGEDKMLEVLTKDELGIGYCNFIYTFDPSTKSFDETIGIVPLDINQNDRLDMKENFYGNFIELQRAMWLGKYPCILNRPLQLVALQKPATKELHDFLKWVFTDGQKIVTDMGYMELRSSEIKYCLSYLDN